MKITDLSFSISRKCLEDSCKHTATFAIYTTSRPIGKYFEIFIMIFINTWNTTRERLDWRVFVKKRTTPRKQWKR
jgi:hypothetical protein